MGLWTIDDDRLRAALLAVRPGDAALHGEEDAEHLAELVARVVWSVLIEPGDRVAGLLIERLGAVEPARVVLDGGSGAVLAARLPGELGAEELEAALARWRPRARWADILRALEGAARCGAQLIVPGDPPWPDAFLALTDSPPVLLWARGDASLLRRPSIAVVGARAATGYGEHVAMELAAGLAARDAVVVSGGAYGIDGMAHRATLASGGATVAVLAGGLDRLYPSGHEALLTRIAEQGLLLSEAPCGSAPTKWRFLQRNRLIAALADATVVIEAGRRSGALSTAGHALGMGRPVGLVPGPITSAASAGCHHFLRAFETTLITSAADVMRLAYGDDGVLPLDEAGEESTRPTGQSALHTRVLDALRPRRGMGVEEIARAVGESPATIRGALGSLELDERVQLGHDGLWRRAGSRASERSAS